MSVPLFLCLALQSGLLQPLRAAEPLRGWRRAKWVGLLPPTLAAAAAVALALPRQKTATVQVGAQMGVGMPSLSAMGRNECCVYALLFCTAMVQKTGVSGFSARLLSSLALLWAGMDGLDVWPLRVDFFWGPLLAVNFVASCSAVVSKNTFFRGVPTY